MILLTYATTGYSEMVEKHLLPSAANFKVVRIKRPHPVAIWNTEMFVSICVEKAVCILEMAEQLDDGEVFIYCDGDVKLFGLTPEMVLRDLGDADIAAHADRSGPPGDLICVGFFIIKCSPLIREFLFKWVSLTKERKLNDQFVFNSISHEMATLKILPREKYWNLGQAGLYYGGDRSELRLISDSAPSGIVMFHANFAIGPQDKIDLLEAIGNKLK